MSADADPTDAVPADLAQRVAELERENEILRQRLDIIADGHQRLEFATFGDLPPGDVDGDLLSRLESVESGFAEMEATVNPDPDGLDYDHMDREDKARLIRRALVDEAKTTGGKAAFNYKEVRQRLGGKPSPGHAYDIMELAGEADGFDYNTSTRTDTKRVTVDIDAVNDHALLSRGE